MKDFWNKIVKIAAVTAACLSAFIAAIVLSVFAYLGGNAFLIGAKLQENAPTVIIGSYSVENTFCSLGYAFLTLLINLSSLMIITFILIVWLLTVIWILREDITKFGNCILDFVTNVKKFIKFWLDAEVE